MNRPVEKIIWLLLLATVLDAPLRYGLVQAGGPFLIYLKDVLILGLLFYIFLHAAFTSRIDRTFLVFLLVVLYGVAVGLINRLPIVQVLFGAKMLLPFIVGYLAVNELGFRRTVFAQWYRIVIPIVLLGLALDISLDLPWKDLTYQAMDRSIESARDRSAFGLARLSGFGRSPQETAIILFSLVALYLGLRTCDRESISKRVRIYDILLFAGASAGVVVTTFKSAILAFVVLGTFFLVLRWYQRHGRGITAAVGPALKTTLLALFLYGLVPPIVSVISPTILTRYLASDDIMFRVLVASYVDRVERMWPAAFDLLAHPYQYVTGRGLGGIGAAQVYFEPHRYNPADNVYVYLFVDFGLVLLALFLFSLLYRLYRSNTVYRANMYLYGLVIGLLCFGATVNVVESPALTLTLGFMLALWKKEG